MSTPTDGAHAYAWNWFALHAGQRMQLVNFWLIAVAFLGAAYVQAEVARLSVVAAGTAAAGVASSAAFLLLDERTRQLVRLAEEALAELEVAGDPAIGGIRLVSRSSHRRSAVHSYRVVIRALHVAVAVLFAGACVRSLMS